MGSAVYEGRGINALSQTAETNGYLQRKLESRESPDFKTDRSTGVLAAIQRIGRRESDEIVSAGRIGPCSQSLARSYSSPSGNTQFIMDGQSVQIFAAGGFVLGNSDDFDVSFPVS